ncbi:glycosyltransferase [Flavobacterium sp. NPDC079362]|uniref:glycosyltransferase n=1 Tax=Flavobacterium sp. NPDC079362 TaxID=3390566 RepID=UPI003CFFDAE3
MEKKKILIFSDCYIYGGSEKLMAFLLKNEVLKQNYTLLYSYRTHKEYEVGLKNENISTRANNFPLFLMSNNTLFYKINCLSISKYWKGAIKVPFFLAQKFRIYFLWNLLTFIYLLIKTKPDLIHVNNGGYPGAITCNTLVVANFLTIRTKVIYQVNNQALSCNSYFERIYDNFIHKNVNCFINASLRAKQQLVEKRNFDSNKVFLVDNCVPLPKVKMNREHVFKELNIPLNSFLIVEVAFLSERKGQKFLIDALNSLYKKQLISAEKVYCAFIGNGEQEAFLRNYINELGLSSSVFLLGYRTNSEDFIAACDLFVLPSIRDEDMPLVVLSALGYGKPIISTDFAGISQVIKTNVNGVLIENKLETFTNSLANEVYRLYIDSALRKELGTSAKKTYVNFSPKAYGEKLKQIYEQIYAS